MEEPRVHLKPNTRNLGILGVEPYFPADYVSHAELESYMKIPAGKFTRGIGQTSMSIPSDRQDPVSIALTATHRLMERYSINPKDIGRLEIGTESMVDRSRSMKSYLMEHIFRESGNFDLEGCTSIMACYGGTNALFNSLNWLESSVANGKLAIVVMTDISRYGENSSIPTMGAGALAILLGPEAPIVFSPYRSTYFDYADDFYKPVKENEYPVVNSQLSIHTYLKTVAATYFTLQHKQPTRLHDVDYCVFHAPFAKMVQKAFSQLYYADQLIKHEATDDLNCVLDSKSIAQVQKKSYDLFTQKCLPGLAIPKLIGNSYTASLYFCFLSLLADVSLDLSHKNILFFSYGSGCAASLFTAQITPAYSRMAGKIRDALGPLIASRVKISPEMLFLRKEKSEVNYFRKGYEPDDSTDNLSYGAYYLESVDSRYIRKYKRKGAQVGKERLTRITAQILSSKSSQGVWGGFYQKPMQERVDQIGKIFPSLRTHLYKRGGLSHKTANLMIENCIGLIQLPLGLGLNFKIDNEHFTIPMVIEEPSVIAATSSVAKLVAKNGGFRCNSSLPIMIGQIQLLAVPEVSEVHQKLERNKAAILKHANEAIPSMVKRGGGVTDVRCKILETRGNESVQVIVELLVNVCDSMGANIVNTVCEHTAPYLTDILGGSLGICILSNLASQRTTKVELIIPLKSLGWKGMSGIEVGQRMMQAHRFAELDIHRAATHNKGILNGIDATAIALGQDWRAIEAGAHAYAAKSGRYTPLTKYALQDGQLHASLEMPMAVGTQGGVLNTNPLYANNMALLKNPSATRLAQIMLCVGLANNFAALRAMSVQGIQKGHMGLHARNIALAAGVPQDLVPETVKFMKAQRKITSSAAKQYMIAHNIYSALRKQEFTPDRSSQLSTLFVEVVVEGEAAPISLNLVLETNSSTPIHINIVRHSMPQQGDLSDYLFGSKSYQWLQNILTLVTKLRPHKAHERLNADLIAKIKLLTILSNLLLSNLLQGNRVATRQFLTHFYSDADTRKAVASIPCSAAHKFGLFLLLELQGVFGYYLETIPSVTLKQCINVEMQRILQSLLKATFEVEMGKKITDKETYFWDFFHLRRKRLNATMIMLSDLLSSDSMSESRLSHALELGEYFEVKATVIRDSRKNGKLNSFSLYRSLFQGSRKEYQKYVLESEYMRDLETKVKTNKCFSNDLFSRIQSVLERYYHTERPLL